MSVYHKDLVGLDIHDAFFYGREGWIDSRSCGTLEEADIAASVQGKMLLVCSQHTIIAPTTLNSFVMTMPGACFIKAGAATITFNGGFSAGRYQVFSAFLGTDIVFGFGLTEAIFPEWFKTNAIPGTTDMRLALQIAINAASNSHGTIKLANTTYNVGSALDAVHLLKIKSNVSIVGDKYSSVVKVSDNLLSATQGLGLFYSNDVEVNNVILEKFTIDFNGENNLWQSGFSTVSRVGCAGGGSNFSIRNMEFKNASASHFIYLSSPDVSEDPLVRVGMENCEVKDCSFYNCGGAIAGNGITDHSSIYIDANNSLIEGNRLVQPNLDDIHSTAMEVHGSNIIVSDNQVYGYAKLLNIAAQVRSASHIVAIGNSAMNVINGVWLWSGEDYLLSHVEILSNTIGLRDVVSAVNSFGVLASATTMVSSRKGSHLKIKDNDIYSMTINDLGLQSKGIMIYRWDDLTTIGNDIYNFPAEAIYIYSESDIDILNCLVATNKIRDCGIGTNTSTKRVIAFVAAGSYTNLKATGNQIICGSGEDGTPAEYGIAFNSGATYNNTDIRDNFITDMSVAKYKNFPNIAGNIPTFANNAAAIIGGLKAGETYRTGGDPDTICIVH